MRTNLIQASRIEPAIARGDVGIDISYNVTSYAVYPADHVIVTYATESSEHATRVTVVMIS
ncbi:hypothetical protein [Nocardia arizonensis]|uniref:hypothetical protein n=1 Tax=Nocardia arizonensis TaxID=1141647 RepID=UPI0006D21241|nr:hypothetical protein [Nocardia arizonensis]